MKVASKVTNFAEMQLEADGCPGTVNGVDTRNMSDIECQSETHK